MYFGTQRDVRKIAVDFIVTHGYNSCKHLKYYQPLKLRAVLQSKEHTQSDERMKTLDVFNNHFEIVSEEGNIST